MGSRTKLSNEGEQDSKSGRFDQIQTSYLLMEIN
jgi:hypothetical protein